MKNPGQARTFSLDAGSNAIGQVKNLIPLKRFWCWRHYLPELSQLVFPFIALPFEVGFLRGNWVEKFTKSVYKVVFQSVLHCD